MSEDQELRVERRGAVLWLTLQREQRRNALNAAVVAGLTQALAAAERQPELRAIVLTGAGEQAFCAGADLQAGGSFKFDHSQPYQGFADLLRQAHRCTLPLLARVNGVCMAGGMGLLAMCDLAVAADTARFGLPEVKLGLFPAQVLAVLQPLVGARALTQWCLSGESFDSATALASGLLNRVVPASALDTAVDDMLASLLANSPSAIRRGLYTLKQTRAMGFEQAMAMTESQIGLFAMTEDAQEGLLAFREKRAPNWTGK